MADWIAQDFSIGLFEPNPASRGQLGLAHTQKYVDGILNCELMNGFLGRQQDVAQSLPWTCGSMLSAARAALGNVWWPARPLRAFIMRGLNLAMAIAPSTA